jgi:hypothetical protein
VQTVQPSARGRPVHAGGCHDVVKSHVRVADPPGQFEHGVDEADSLRAAERGGSLVRLTVEDRHGATAATSAAILQPRGRSERHARRF